MSTASLRHGLWAGWVPSLVVAYVLLLPFSRSAEIPLTLLALAAPLLAWRHGRELWSQPVARLLVVAFLAWWLPMLLASIDAVVPGKSWLHALTAPRFLLAALSIAVVMREPLRRRWLLVGFGAIIGVWALDGLIQFAFGRDLLGIPLHPDRVNAMFGDRFYFYGPSLAMLSPLAFEAARRYAPRWLLGVLVAGIGAAVLLAGMRAGWLALALIAVIYALGIARRDRVAAVRYGVAIIGLAATLGALGYLGSELVRDRVQQTLKLVQGNEQAVQHAFTRRLQIWGTAGRMIAEHPVNGVGIRGFQHAYPDYARPGDPNLSGPDAELGGNHPHNLWLESLTDAGLAGLAGLLVALACGIVAWRRSSPAGREAAAPYAFCLGVMLFPFNTHFALYGAYLSSTLWWLAGLMFAGLLSATTAAGRLQGEDSGFGVRKH